MWTAISRLFVKARPEDEDGGPASPEQQQQHPLQARQNSQDSRSLADDSEMDYYTANDGRKSSASSEQYSSASGDENYSDTSAGRQAKQRASVKWLLSKAYNNRVPDKLRDPYYRDHEDQEHLKPQIVHALSNAELYCLALANIYSDPNYHNQNHTGILQALARKGVYVNESSNGPLTETILIQNSPLKMSAHMSVIEGLMVLYAKEVVTADRVLAAVQRFDPRCKVETPQDHEMAILTWIGHASRALIGKIQAEEGGPTMEERRLPDLPAVKDFGSLCDGVGMAAVVAYYCPGELDWTEIRVSKRHSVADALHNLSLVFSFCVRCLPYPIFHMQPEDVTYMRSSMKQNLVVFLAELYNVLEIHPAKCVRYPGETRAQQYLDECPRNSYGVVHTRSLPQTVTPVIPDLRSNLLESSSGFTGILTKPPVQNPVRKSQSMHHPAESHYIEDRKITSDENFVSYRIKSSPNQVADDNNKSFHKAEAAGRPSNWDEHRRSTYAGRRSRRNSVTDDSQLTIENFGGSQDNLHNIGRNPDKVVGKHHVKHVSTEPTLPARSSIQDVYGSGVHSILTDNGHSNSQDDVSNKLKKQKTLSVSLKNILHSVEGEAGPDGESPKMSCFANLHKSSEKSINLNFTDQDKDDLVTRTNFAAVKKNGQSNGSAFGEKKTSFATLPNMTTWQQQSNQQTQQSEKQSNDNNGGAVLTSQLNNIRLKLEEKKRHIENEKRKMEVIMSKNRQKVGKAAFLQAVTKGKVKSPSSSTSGGESPMEAGTPNNPVSCGLNEEPSAGLAADGVSLAKQSEQDKPQRPFTLKEISEDVRDVEHKWLDQDGAPFVETRRTPDIENMDIDQYHQSITHMNSSLSEIQADIQRLANQQNQIQQQHLISQHQQQMQHQLQQLHSLNQQHMQVFNVSPQNQMMPRVHDSPQSQFYLHDQPQVPRRTWGQPQPIQSLTNEIAQVGYQQSMDSRYSSPQIYQQDPRMYQDARVWGMPVPQQRSFLLHDNSQDQRYLNGGDQHSLGSQHHLNSFQTAQNLFSQTPPSSASPQHRNAVHRISQLMNDSIEIKRPNTHSSSILSESPVEKRLSSLSFEHNDTTHQNLSYQGDDEDFTQGIRNLNISSGSRTYRIPSPTRPSISRNSFQPHASLRETTPSPSGSKAEIVPLDSNEAEKGFYISFDDAPKKPKPSLRTKKASPKKERCVSAYIDRNDYLSRYESSPSATMDKSPLDVQRANLEKQKQRSSIGETLLQKDEAKTADPQKELVRPRQRSEGRQSNQTNNVGLIIGNVLSDLDPNSVDEMERKKEKIMLLSLQRRQQQEEAKERKEAEAQERREKEKLKEEEMARKKDEEKQRRAAILEQYKLKKAIEEAEREGKHIDKDVLNAIKPAKLRTKSTPSRPRPKTIHVDAGSELDSGVLTPSRGKKGSSSNLSTASLMSTPMRRDYYRGSQDSLAAHMDDRRSGTLYRATSLRVSSVDSPDDGRGSSPSRSTQQLGRRGSYKTSRDVAEQPTQVRGRSKYTGYQNLRGRKSTSMMNLCDSGLGRATPPRRAASPGMGSLRHLPSPSGPGSLPPGFMTKRRVFDDNSSDISSTASSMLDYNGPRLYKAPAMKSNRGIMLNAVEYCVFPGTVNREAKQRVLDEISRSESKHFLILFRDAGCQFRALYSYCPERDEIHKLYGTGPKQVFDKMFDKFFKYNSGGKCFSQVHTKHLTVTIDAFTIHNSLWQGKKVNLPNKKDMALVI